MEILLFFQSIRSDILTMLFTTFTICTETMSVILIATILYWCIDKKCGQRLLFALISSITINSIIKNTLKVKRPIGSEGLESMRIETATGYSFPSGHTQTATTVWVSIMEYFKNKWIIILGIIMILGAGVSRLYLGVHWPSDVLGGLIIGTIISLAFVKIFDYIDETKSYYILFIILIVFGVIVYFIQEKDLIKYFGMCTGFVLGYIVEDKFINFTTKESNKQVSIFTNKKAKIKLSTKVFRFILGIVTLGLVYVVFKYLEVLLFQNSKESILIMSAYIRYFLVVFWGMAGVPALFKVFGLD